MAVAALGKEMRGVGGLIVAIIAVVATGWGASAAEITVAGHGDGGHRFLLKGDIAEEDADRLQQVLDANFSDQWVLQLNSTGGSFPEALKIAALVRDRHVGTQVEAGAVCAGPCGLVFLAGTWRPDDTTRAQRAIHPKGRVLLQAPYPALRNASFTRQQVEAAHDAGLKAAADLLRLAATVQVDPAVLPLILEKGRRAAYEIRTVDDVGRFRLQVTTEVKPLRFAPEMLVNYCKNVFAWIEHNSAIATARASLKEPALEGRNRWTLYREFRAGRSAPPLFTSRFVDGVLRVALPIEIGPEDSTYHCIVDLEGDALRQTLSCRGFLNGIDGTVDEVFDKAAKGEFEHACEVPGHFSQGPFTFDQVAVAPPDTPLAEIDDVLMAYRKMDDWQRLRPKAALAVPASAPSQSTDPAPRPRRPAQQ